MNILKNKEMTYNPTTLKYQQLNRFVCAPSSHAHHTHLFSYRLYQNMQTILSTDLFIKRTLEFFFSHSYIIFTKIIGIAAKNSDNWLGYSIDRKFPNFEHLGCFQFFTL